MAQADEVFKTMGKLAAYFYEFDGDDEKKVTDCILEVVEIRDNGELEIRWQVGEEGRYLDFRWKDLQRAVAEYKASQ